jgi:hypothetical protein
MVIADIWTIVNAVILALQIVAMNRTFHNADKNEDKMEHAG